MDAKQAHDYAMHKCVRHWYGFYKLTKYVCRINYKGEGNGRFSIGGTISWVN